MYMCKTRRIANPLGTCLLPTLSHSRATSKVPFLIPHMNHTACFHLIIRSDNRAVY